MPVPLPALLAPLYCLAEASDPTAEAPVQCAHCVPVDDKPAAGLLVLGVPQLTLEVPHAREEESVETPLLQSLAVF